ncbi:substrate-binding domain-containing protein [Pseudomonas costantinii]|uniref:Phosphate-binding protein PstS n=1 Tax=Pseudomonas costantinii TaxID=168469 RepID=A0A1S2V0Q3_9PSED|nr:substrate-binding domain-containing protein [Pseudomonas costantinii]NVZ23782.1 substrate-binding domain-containing protein [Pseudomonas costantinii]OIN52189.1 alkaline phosphatase [Pseudomonas costantinii]SED34858.1 ABC-type phosphate transport system, substrate-binding protein [Pseudomonas costantinii]
MFKRTMIAASLVVAALASAQSMAAVVGGGATLPEKLYGTTTGTGILASTNPGFNAYVGVGSGDGKKAFFGNDSTKLKLAAGITVDYAGSDSIVSAAELAAYNAATNTTNGRASFGPLIQIPSAATSVTVPYHIDGQTSLQLTSAQLADIFAGKITNWQQVAGPDLQIKVVYRLDTSGTTEIFTNHLKTVKPASVPAVSNSFATAVGFNPATNAPTGSSYIGATGSQGVATAVADSNNNGAIGYVSPDFSQFDQASAVAAINGSLPTKDNVQLALTEATLPTVDPAKSASNPIDWVPTFPNPSQGYPIVGYTNLIFSQCYKDTTDSARIRNFLNRHNTGVDNAAVSSHAFIPVPANWQKAILDTFYASTSSLRVGDTNTCNGIGRPL